MQYRPYLSFFKRMAQKYQHGLGENRMEKHEKRLYGRYKRHRKWLWNDYITFTFTCYICTLYQIPNYTLFYFRKPLRSKYYNLLSNESPFPTTSILIETCHQILPESCIPGYRPTSFNCTLLYCTSQMLHGLQIVGKTHPHQQKGYILLSRDTLF